MLRVSFAICWGLTVKQTQGMANRVNYAAHTSFFYRAPGKSYRELSVLPQSYSDIPLFIQTLKKDLDFLSALQVASPDLYQQMSFVENSKPDPSIVHSIIKYFTRYCTNPTPYGLFAGVGVGVLSNDQLSGVEITPCSGQLDVRLDMGWLSCMRTVLEKDQTIMRRLKYQFNTSLYAVGDRYRYLSYSLLQNGKRKYQLEELVSNEALIELIPENQGYKAYSEWVGQVAGMGFDLHASQDFIESLIEAQVLISNLEPILTEQCYQKYLKEQLSPFLQHPVVKEFNFLLGLLEPDVLAPSKVDLTNVFSKLEEFNFSIPLKKSIHVDLYHTANRAVMSKQLANDVLMAIRIQRALTPGKGDEKLDRMLVEFKRRFGTERVPLALALDPDFGVSMDGSWAQQKYDVCDLIDDLAHYGNPGRTKKVTNKYQYSLESAMHPKEAEYYDIKPDDLHDLEIHQGDWPQQLFALIQLFGAEKDPGVFLELSGAGQPGYLCGRFGNGPADQIHNCLQDWVSVEEGSHPDLMFVDLIHLPESRTGNILQHPSVYQHEFPYLCESREGKRERIRLDDLLIGLEQDSLVIWHRGSGKRVIPRLLNAHNYSQNQVPVYEFLVRLGKQFESEVYVHPDPNQPGFRPGIRYQRVILRLPNWNISAEYFKAKLGEHFTLESAVSHLKSLGVPKEFLCFSDGQSQYIHMEVDVLCDIFFKLLNESKCLDLQPFIFGDSAPVKLCNKPTSNQIMLCYHQV